MLRKGCLNNPSESGYKNKAKCLSVVLKENMYTAKIIMQ